MAFISRRLILVAVGVVPLAVFYQYILGPTLFVSLGYFRHIEPISSFPYTCRRLTDSALHSCEDMFLNSATRTLYLACSDVTARKHWMPNIGRLDADKRSLTDHIVALDLDSDLDSGPDYTFKTLTHPDYKNHAGSSYLSFAGLTGHHMYAGGITYLYLINNQPSYDPAGTLLPQAFTGANSTIEVFATTALSSSLQHIRTYYHGQISTPNNVAYHPPSDGIYFTNDHGPFKSGIMHSLSPLLGTGDLSYCSSSNPPNCTRVASGFKFPNGLHLSPTDGFLYVPSASDGTIYVYRPEIQYPASHSHDHHGHSHSADSAPYYDGTVALVHTIKAGYPIDNLSEDADGNIYAAAFPNTLIMKKFDDPLGPLHPPSTALRIRRGEWVKEEDGREHLEYTVEKVLEDRDGEVLPAATTVVRDSVTGRLWLSGIVNDFVTVCDPK